jgi:mannosyltransferase
VRSYESIIPSSVLAARELAASADGSASIEGHALRLFPSHALWIGYVAVLAIVVFRGWIVPLSSSFWLDETGTYYIISGSWAQYLDRMAYNIQSPFYTAVLWPVFHLGGTSELVLRLPSILAMAAAAVLVFFIARRLTDASGGVLAMMLFVSMRDVAWLAWQARPYATSMALALVSVWFFLLWLERRTAFASILCGFTLALTFYGHPLFGTLGLVYAVLLAQLCWSGDGPPLRQILLAAGTAACVLSPILPYYLSFGKDTKVYSFAGTPTFAELLSSNHSGMLVGALLLACAVPYLFGSPIRVSRFDTPPFTIRFLIYWIVVPMLALFALSTLSPTKVFVPRYYSLCLPALAIFFALICRNIETARTRLVIVCGSALVMVIGVGPWRNTGSDWRLITNALKSQNYPPGTPVFVRTGYIEAQNLPRLTNPHYVEFILSPIYTYPVPGKIVALPLWPDPKFETYMNDALDRARLTGDQFFVIGDVWVPWFQARFGNAWRTEKLSPAYNMPVRFRRTSGALK